jgi:hypothetical protein
MSRAQDSVLTTSEVVRPSLRMPGLTTRPRRVDVEVLNWPAAIICVLGVLTLVLRRMPLVLRECRKVVAAYYDVLDEVDRRRRARREKQ